MDDLLVQSGTVPAVAVHAQGILPTLRPPLKPLSVSLATEDMEAGSGGEGGKERMSRTVSDGVVRHRPVANQG